MIFSSEMGVYLVKSKDCDSLSSSCFLSRAKNYPLCKAMVNHDQQRIEASGRGEIREEIAGELLEWVRSGGSDG